jgi:hypothetical protein
LSGHDQAAFQRNRRHRNDAVPAHGAVALVVHEQHACVRARRHRLGEDRAVHVGMPARLQHQRPPQMVHVAAHPRALFQHRLAARRRKAIDDQPQRLAGRVRVDCLERQHAIKL